jgi:hypothetical protein
MRALEMTGDPRAVEPLRETAKQLIATLKGGDAAAHSKAADALAYIGAPAVEPLIAALDDKDWHIRMPVIYALGMTGDARAVEPLIAVFNEPFDDKHDVWHAVGDALQHLYRSGKLDPAAKQKILAVPKKNVSYSYEQDGCSKHIDYWIEIEI